MIPNLSSLLELSSSRHSHLCPRQVLGVRMGLAGLEVLGVKVPVTKLTALVIVETDSCFADGIEVSTGTTVGHRTLRVNDMGKIAATFVNVKTGRAMRISPVLDVRQHAPIYAPHEKCHYFAQLEGYQVMPEEELFRFQEVILQPSLNAILSKPGMPVKCNNCGEEIINEREQIVNGTVLCRACANQGYYLSRPARVEICAIMDGQPR